MAASSSNKKSKTVDFQLCFICQLRRNQKYTNCPTLDSIDKLITKTNVLCSYGQTEFNALQNRIKGLSAIELLQKGVSYHNQCYSSLTHKKTIVQAKDRYERGQATGSVSDVKRKKGRPPKSDDASTSASTSQRSTRSQAFDKEMCVICQEDKPDRLINVKSKNMGVKLKAIGQQTNNELLKVRLSNVVGSPDPLTAFAEDMKYHLRCLRNTEREIDKANRPPKQNIIFEQLVSDLEILDMVETEINDPSESSVLNMNDIEQSYIGLLNANGFTLPDNPKYKRYLKKLILENIASVHFNRPPDKTKSEQVLSTKAKETLLADKLAHDTTDLTKDVKVLLEAAKILRRDIASTTPWKFEGTFDNYEPPTLLHLFCKYVIQGLHEVKTMSRAESMNQSASVLAQHFVCAYKSDRQVTYETKNEDVAFNHRTETPLTLSLALDVHKNTRSKARSSISVQPDIEED